MMKSFYIKIIKTENVQGLVDFFAFIKHTVILSFTVFFRYIILNAL